MISPKPMYGFHYVDTIWYLQSRNQVSCRGLIYWHLMKPDLHWFEYNKITDSESTHHDNLVFINFVFKEVVRH